MPTPDALTPRETGPAVSVPPICVIVPVEFTPTVIAPDVRLPASIKPVEAAPPITVLPLAAPTLLPAAIERIPPP